MEYTLGRVGLVLHASYDPTTAYAPLDMVPYQGSSYVAKTQTLGHPPTDAGYWVKVAEAGAKGDPGADALNVELRKTATHIQWRLESGAWADLMPLTDLRGDAGRDGLTVSVNGITQVGGDITLTAGDVGVYSNGQIDQRFRGISDDLEMALDAILGHGDLDAALTAILGV